VKWMQLTHNMLCILITIVIQPMYSCTPMFVWVVPVPVFVGFCLFFCVAVLGKRRFPIPYPVLEKSLRLSGGRALLPAPTNLRLLGPLEPLSYESGPITFVPQQVAASISTLRWILHIKLAAVMCTEVE
jgi:hypothetical protein